MIAEPYICIKGTKSGDIEWLQEIKGMCNPWHEGLPYPDGTVWKPYADFEREKLRELGGYLVIGEEMLPAFTFHEDHQEKWSYSSALIDYNNGHYSQDSVSSRLLHLAKFLKAVCEKEGVEWLPKEKCLHRERITTEDVDFSECTNCGKQFPKPKSIDVVKELTREKSCPCGKHWEDDCPHKQERDYYTKREIDERMSGILDALLALSPPHDHDFWNSIIGIFRSRFLS